MFQICCLEIMLHIYLELDSVQSICRYHKHDLSRGGPQSITPMHVSGFFSFFFSEKLIDRVPGKPGWLLRLVSSRDTAARR